MGNIRELWRPIIVAISAFALFGMYANAEEAKAAVVAVEESSRTWRDMLIDVLLMVAGVGGAVITWVFALGKSKLAKTDAQKEAWDALSAGVNITYNDLVKKFKAARADGKLTEDEKKELRLNAIAQAKDIATGPALQVLKTTALPVLEDWVERIVLSRKSKTAA